MNRSIPRDSTLYQALEYIYTKGFAVLMTRDEQQLPANVDQFVSVIVGGRAPAEVGGVWVTDAGYEEIQRMIRAQYSRFCSLGYSATLDDFKRKYIEPGLPPGCPAIRVLVTLKNQELATEEMYQQLLEPSQKDVVQ